MKSSLVSALLLVLSISYAYGEHVNFQWTDCGTADALLHFHQIEISPLPITLSKTSSMSLSSNVSIERDLPSDTFLELQINKTITIGETQVEVTLPCVDGLGSCAVKVCDLWTLWYNDIICPFFKNVGRECTCPIKSGQFVSQNVKFDVPFGRFQGRAAEFASGDYKINFSLYDSTFKKRLACLNLKAFLTIDHS